MLLAAVVETSRRVAETTKRLEKVDLLARLLKQLHPDEVEIVVAFLTGRTGQGRIGIGYGTLRDAKGSPAPEPSLEVAEIDRTFESITKLEQSTSPPKTSPATSQPPAPPPYQSSFNAPSMKTHSE